MVLRPMARSPGGTLGFCAVGYLSDKQPVCSRKMLNGPEIQLVPEIQLAPAFITEVEPIVRIVVSDLSGTLQQGSGAIGPSKLQI